MGEVAGLVKKGLISVLPVSMIIYSIFQFFLLAAAGGGGTLLRIMRRREWRRRVVATVTSLVAPALAVRLALCPWLCLVFHGKGRS